MFPIQLIALRELVTLLKLAFVVCHPLRLKLYQISSPLLRNSITFAFSKRWSKNFNRRFYNFLHSFVLFQNGGNALLRYTGDTGTSDLTDVDSVCS